MKAEERERLVLLFLPMLIVLVGYVWLVPNTRREELKKLQERTSKARPEQERGDLAQERFRARQLRERADALRARRDAALRELGALPGDAGPQRRMEALRDVVTLLGRHGLEIVEAASPAGGESFRLPLALQAAIERREAALRQGQADDARSGARHGARTRAPAAATQAAERPPAQREERLPWRVRLIGPYMDVLAALEELSGSETPAVPVGLSLQETVPGNRLHAWTLVVWV